MKFIGLLGIALVSGQFFKKCGSDADCNSLTYCPLFECVSKIHAGGICSANKPCLPGLNCVHYKCVDPNGAAVVECNHNQECATGSYCKISKVAHSHFAFKGSCNQYPPIGGSCSSQTLCGPGSVCKMFASGWFCYSDTPAPTTATPTTRAPTTATPTTRAPTTATPTTRAPTTATPTTRAPTTAIPTTATPTTATPTTAVPTTKAPTTATPTTAQPTADACLAFDDCASCTLDGLRCAWNIDTNACMSGEACEAQFPDQSCRAFVEECPCPSWRLDCASCLASAERCGFAEEGCVDMDSCGDDNCVTGRECPTVDNDRPPFRDECEDTCRNFLAPTTGAPTTATPTTATPTTATPTTATPTTATPTTATPTTASPTTASPTTASPTTATPTTATPTTAPPTEPSDPCAAFVGCGECNKEGSDERCGWHLGTETCMDFVTCEERFGSNDCLFDSPNLCPCSTWRTCTDCLVEGEDSRCQFQTDLGCTEDCIDDGADVLCLASRSCDEPGTNLIDCSRTCDGF